MPVSHVGLTVSHLPTSTSFFLSVLQPLGYRYFGQWGPQIGLGVHEADFFLTQEMPGIPASASHVAFAAPSRAAVREFFSSALLAGARSHGVPAPRYDDGACFNAAVLDFDGNSIEVVFHDEELVESASVGGHSRVLTWREDIVDNLGEAKSVVTTSSARSAAMTAAQKALFNDADASVVSRSNAPPKAPSVASSEVSAKGVLSTLQRSLMGSDSANLLLGDSRINISPKTLAGTLLGAAAGAAVAYAMCKSEEDSARAELESSYPAPSRQSRLRELPPPLALPSPKTVRNAGSHHSASMRPGSRAIEEPPAYQPLSLVSTRRHTMPAMKAIEYIPASNQSHVSVPRSTVARSARAPAPTFLEAQPEQDYGSTHLKPHRPRSHLGPSSARSEVSRQSKHLSSSSKRRPKSEAPPRARSTSTRLGKVMEDRAVTELPNSPPPDYMQYVNDQADLETVAPSDSISCSGSGRSKRSRRSKHGRRESSKSVPGSRARSEERKGSSRTSRKEIVKSDGISEAESEETVTPKKYKKRSSVMTLPIRGITPSILKGDGRTVASWCR